MSATGHPPGEAGVPERGLQPATPGAAPADDAAPLTGEDATLLDRIARAARDVRAVKAAFKKNPAPELTAWVTPAYCPIAGICPFQRNDTLLRSASPRQAPVRPPGATSGTEASLRGAG
jgi:hypothetical protein